MRLPCSSRQLEGDTASFSRCSSFYLWALELSLGLLKPRAQEIDLIGMDLDDRYLVFSTWLGDMDPLTSLHWLHMGDPGDSS